MTNTEGNSSSQADEKKKVEVKYTVHLLKVYRNSRAEVRISPSSQRLMNTLTNRSFEVILSKRKRVDYQILSKDKMTGLITLSLKFEDYSKISSGSETDFLEVRLNKDMSFENTEQIITYDEDPRSERFIPP